MTRPTALRLLDVPCPPDVAASVLGCELALFQRVPADRLTLAEAFRLAHKAAMADLLTARARKRKVIARRKSTIMTTKKAEARASVIAAQFKALLADDLDQTADRLADFDLGSARKVQDVARRLGAST